MTDGNTYEINRRLDEREDWDALEEVTAELEQAEARIEELEAELARALEDSEKYKHAFAAQSRKLQAVLHIEGVKATLAELRGQDDE